VAAAEALDLSRQALVARRQICQHSLYPAMTRFLSRPLSSLWTFLARLLSFKPGKAMLALGLMVGMSLTEGVGLLRVGQHAP
jgi:hypothetical protein